VNVHALLLFVALAATSLFADAHLFVFHRFDDAKHLSTSTSTKTLRAEFDYLKANGYEVIPLSRLAEALEKGEPVDDKWVVFTIDDNYKSFYEHGLPVFKEYGFPFTLFVYVEATDKNYPDYMSWDDVRDSARYGEIGLHSYGHDHLCTLSATALQEDTRKALQSFTKKMDFKPRYYAYPYGEFGPETKKTVSAFGFDLILNQNSGAVNETSDPLDLDRIALTGENLLAQKLRIRRLDAQWLAPLQWPKNGRLKEIHAKISPEHTRAELYVTGHGWRWVTARNGEILENLDLPLGGERVRLFLKVGHRQNGTILAKE